MMRNKTIAEEWNGYILSGALNGLADKEKKMVEVAFLYGAMVAIGQSMDICEDALMSNDDALEEMLRLLDETQSKTLSWLAKG